MTGQPQAWKTAGRTYEHGKEGFQAGQLPSPLRVRNRHLQAILGLAPDAHFARREYNPDVHVHTHQSGEGFSHGRPTPAVLAGALAATLGLVAAELAGGYLGHSIALTSDAVHNLSDVPTIVISWLALRWSVRPADAQRTFGYGRAGILAAFTNAILLLLVALGLFWEASQRLLHPVPVHEQWMIGLSLAALAVNGGITLSLARHHRDLNFRALLVHNLGDALSNVAILAGALVIRFSGMFWLDPALGIAIGGLVLWSSFGILRESGHILLEGLPRQMQLVEVAKAILSVAGVQEVHDVHIWTLGADDHALSCHVRIPDMHMDQSERILQSIQQRLAHDFRIHHVTIQFERAGLPATAVYVPAPSTR
jgi:cobalt-zinc-cadmium efflux system protein